ncbi:MAG: tetratricopeptide repeat protein [Candidatus Aminicenantes bacterium]|nr:tetratricopeptide repeat protein [Candidatus Aminicenantes bacterium]
MNTSPSTQWSFRPAQMPEEMFMKTFVGREKEIDMIFSHINFNLIPPTSPGNKKNLLIKAERGIGKTSLFLAVKYKLKAEQSGMLKKIIPVFFNEQEDFNTAEKLIIRIFEIISLSHLPPWEKEYREIRNNIDSCFRILKDNLQTEEKKLVLFIENFDSVVYRVLRKKGSKKTGRLGSQDTLTKLVRDPDIILLCSALDDPETPHDYGKETFETIELKPVPDFYELVLRRARYDNNLFLLANKEKLRNKIRAFEYLTGGNTRLMVHLYECMAEKDIHKLETMLNDMINKSTPLFEWVIEKFVDFESREILNDLARRGGNATVREIAEDTFNTESSVRTLLNNLRKKRFVQKTDEKRDKSDIYIMIPMIFFIWYQKSVLQRKDIILDFFLHFVDLFFDPTELSDKSKIEQAYRLKDDQAEAFAPYFSYSKKYIEAGKFPLKSSDEIREEEPRETAFDNEKMVYEVVRARNDDHILKTQVHNALLLKAENKQVEAANLFRIAAMGYLILSKKSGEEFYVQAEENIRRAIEIYQAIKTEPLDTVRCILILVQILSDTGREEEAKLFARTIIRIGKKSQDHEFNTYLGRAYKHLGFAEQDPEEKLTLFNQALEYFQKDETEKEQVIILLVNIGLVYKLRNKYETALNYFEKALELNRYNNSPIHLNCIIHSVMTIYRDTEDFHGGLIKIAQILEWLEQEHFEGIDYKWLYETKADFLYKNEEYFETEKFFIKGIELAREENDRNSYIYFLSRLIEMYAKLNLKEKAEERLKEVENIIKDRIGLPIWSVLSVTNAFFENGHIDKAISIYEKSYKEFQDNKDFVGQAFTLFNLGSYLMRKGNFPEAIENYRKAIEIAKSINFKDILYSATNNLVIFLNQSGCYDESISLLEDLEKECLSNDTGLKKIILEKLFSSYLTKSKEEYNKKNFDCALVYAEKAFKYLEHISIEDFIKGFYFNFVLPLIESAEKKVYPFFKDLDLHLSEYYENKEKGEYIKIFKYVVALVKGEDFARVVKDLTPPQRDLLNLINGKLKKEIPPEKIITYPADEKSNPGSRIALAQTYMMEGSTQSLLNAQKELETIKVDMLNEPEIIHNFYYSNIVLPVLTQNRGAIKHTLTTLLFLVKDSPAGFIAHLKVPGLSAALAKKIPLREYELIDHLERLLRNQTPVSTFVKKFKDSIEPGMIDNIETDIPNASAGIFKRVLAEGMTEIAKIIIICGSRMKFESLLYLLKKEFPTLPGEKQSQVISLLTQVLEKTMESYKWLVLDFCSQNLVHLNPVYQSALIDSLLVILVKKEDGDNLLNEVWGFIQTAKNILDESLKIKIEKKLIDLKEEVEK